ncbi:MAG: hypothetical protein K2O78_08385 [Muribaculaceae bacterium]|nr:hypothetical protein [Muribaculaceae bacterium]
MAGRNTIQSASKANRKASAQTNTRERRTRITAEAVSGATHKGDFTNRSAMRQANRSYTGQNFGTHKTRYADLVAAFGRARRDQVDENGNLRTGRGGTASLSFSAG